MTLATEGVYRHTHADCFHPFDAYTNPPSLIPPFLLMIKP